MRDVVLSLDGVIGRVGCSCAGCAVAAAAEAGRTQRDTAATLDISQSAIYKMLVRARHTRGLHQQTPWEIVLRYAPGEMSHPAMLDALASWPWSPDRVLDPDSPEPERFVAGNWHDLDRAVRFGYLTDEDDDVVLARVR